MRVFGVRLKSEQIDDIDETNLQVRRMLAKNRHGGQASGVATSPPHATTTSGSSPASLLAHSQMPMPLVQCMTAASMSELQVQLLVGNDYVDVILERRQ